jgi:hypothetical protein
VEAEAEAEVAGDVVVVAVGVVVVEVGDGAGAVAFSAAGGEVVSAGVAGSAHSLQQALNSAPSLAGLLLWRQKRFGDGSGQAKDFRRELF